MKKFFITAGAIVALAVPSAAMADVTNNPSTKDCHGYATANAVVNIIKEGAMPGNTSSSAAWAGPLPADRCRSVGRQRTARLRCPPRLEHRPGLLRHHQQRLSTLASFARPGGPPQGGLYSLHGVRLTARPWPLGLS